ncbi:MULTISPECIES: Rrf2 family transcriptional regulator [Fructobacillus]|jgi:DNA-binding IscR family transcriptional regulator|uniref:IscR family (IscR) n=1 Tax=Fructobacillus cardui TaxID=2893170 RepID=A0ABM9MYR1_9LACO|nr:Rrf2 family transcriptional regulator [Fructobacillus sp. EFB-N1]KMK53213.1 putative HTH-type transcriptional regulator YwnA [Fructobacillus sp. EFB-N1]CAK1221562.1 DNA-binding transcriptional regulator [Fructobacillus cardui]CAK1249662.1 DNA-binding transcriptional regulator [Fructobacillus cardui]CAK1250723.1 DNA-binding transcriptional regulator [Fructobacillus cardui]
MKPSLRLTNALHILVYVATARPTDSLSSATIADSINTNPSRVRALLAELQNADILCRQGPYPGRPVLAKDSKDITFAEVLQAVEDCAAVFALDKHTNPDCPVGSSIGSALSKYYGEIDQAVMAVMGEMTLFDLVEDVKKNQTLPI